jgi:uncharacterized protein
MAGGDIEWKVAMKCRAQRLETGASAPWLVDYYRYRQPGWFTLEQLSLELPGFPPSARPLTIGQLSDLHVSAAIPPYLVEEAAQALNAQRPDAIVITGDFVTFGPLYLEAAARSVAGLKAPLGVYAILGNHDYWCGARRLTRLLEARGIEVLINATRRLPLEGGGLWLVGLDDALLGKPDLVGALHDVPDDEARVLLVHEPDFADLAAGYGIPLQLSGHSHGGQIRHGDGVLALPKMGRRYVRGLQQVEGSDMLVYTNRGIGTAGPPLRVNSPPEITMLTLRGCSPDPAGEP